MSDVRARIESMLSTAHIVSPARDLNGAGAPEAEAPVSPIPARRPLDWPALDGREPPPREWIIPHWMPAGHLTLLAGRGGIGKTLLAQHIGSAIALGSDYLSSLAARRVLMWAGEDDVDELWRRQIAISTYLRAPLAALTQKFTLHSYSGADITLLAPVYGKLEPTSMMSELAAQVRDYGAEVVILDNIARLFGGNENDRHAVTTFCALVQGACAPAAVLLLGHPAKVVGSEFSGSTAWEGAVRARLYLSDRPPDAKPEEDDSTALDNTVRYLSRRKANYSSLDIRRFKLCDGVLAPDSVEPARAAGRVSGEFAKDIVRRAVRTLAARDLYGTNSTSSTNYLTRLACEYGLLDGISKQQFAGVMREMILSGELVSTEVGKYSNRNPRKGLVLK